MGQNGFIFPKFRGENKDSFWGVGLYYTVDGSEILHHLIYPRFYTSFRWLGMGFHKTINIITFRGFATMVFFSPKTTGFCDVNMGVS